MKLGYWNIRGMAQPIRYLLAYRNVEFEEKFYTCGPPPEFDRSSWLNEKYTHGLDFPNLPYLIDGDVKLTQTLAIMRYLARKFDLEGNTCEEKRRVELVEQQITDIKFEWAILCYNPKFAEDRVGFEKKLPGTLEELSNFLGERPYFAGDRLTYVDFLVYECLDQLLVFSERSFARVKNLTDFVERVKALPTMRTYLESDACIKWPFFFDPATYGSRLNERPF